jgi:putative membrane protein
MNPDEQSSKAIGPIIGISFAILAFLFWLIYFKTPAYSDAGWVKTLPTILASLNAVSACCLAVGLVAIKRGIKRVHIASMISATVSSAVFLVLYIIYHHYHGNTKFLGEGIIRPIYFFILISHILLSVVVVPLIFLTLWFAKTKRYDRHKRIAKWTFPIWMYVSVTGILVYLILNTFNAA